MMNIDLSGKRAIVCGSTQGIGKAIAEELAVLGAGITLIARNQQKLEAVKAGLNTSSGQQHDILVADFSEPGQLKLTVQNYLAQGKAADILINNTGGPPAGKALEAETEAYLQAFSNHLICNQILVQEIVPLMKKEHFGRIINIISTSVKTPLPGLGVSNTIRGAVASWAKTLSLELAPFGITINNVLPGFTETGRLESLIANKAEKAGKSRDEVAAAMIAEIPAGRFASAEEVAVAVAFLASPAAAYINGINLPVDGGRTACL